MLTTSQVCLHLPASLHACIIVEGAKERPSLLRVFHVIALVACSGSLSKATLS